MPPPGAATHVVVPGGRFKAGEFKRWFYGANYRDLWNTPIEVAVLDLDGVGGGLTPLRTGGFGQSVSLHFTGNDGRRYTVRSLDKDATRRVPDEIANTVVGEVLQDLICAMLPTGALVVDPLMEATGILHSRHTLVVIPDDPRLEEYRGRFAGLIGMLQEHPSEGKDDAPGFAGSRKVSGTDKLRDHLEKSPCNRVDARAFLKARLMDFLVNDKDRHYGQWRWARFPDGDCYTWLPIPEDRDQAFIHFEGVAMAIARGRFPIQIKFKEKFPSLIGLSMTGWEIDREFLAELDRAAWNSVVSAFRKDLPDPVIDNAVRKLPPPYYSLIGESLTRALKSRRDALPEFAGRYYEMINREAEIKTTDKDEYVHCEHLPDGNLNVRIGLMKGAAGEKKPPYFQRTFQPGETREVRIHLRGGDDRAEVSGPGGPIVVHIDGGGGDDTLTNGSESGASKTRFYDSRGKNRFVTGEGARIDESSYQRPHGTHTPNARYALDWGKRTGSLPIFMIDPDLTVYTGLLHTRQYFGYRKDPFSAQHTFVAGLAGVNGFESVRPFLSYTGHFRRPLREFDANVRFDFSGIRSLRFYGFGNETEIRRPRSFYKVTRYSRRSYAGAGVSRSGLQGRNVRFQPGFASVEIKRPLWSCHQVFQHPIRIQQRDADRFPGQPALRCGRFRSDWRTGRNQVRYAEQPGVSHSGDPGHSRRSRLPGNVERGFHVRQHKRRSQYVPDCTVFRPILHSPLEAAPGRSGDPIRFLKALFWVGPALSALEFRAEIYADSRKTGSREIPRCSEIPNFGSFSQRSTSSWRVNWGCSAQPMPAGYFTTAILQAPANGTPVSGVDSGCPS